MKHENRSNQAVPHLTTISDTHSSTQQLSPGVKFGAAPKIDCVLADQTGPFDQLFNRRMLVILDVENISLTACDLSFRVSYSLITEKLKAATSRCLLHAFFCQQQGDRHRIQHFKSCGWTPHPWNVEYVRTREGWKRRANSDNNIFFTTGYLLARTSIDTVLIGTGDGDLGCDLARFISDKDSHAQILTISLPSSTSDRLGSTTNPLIQSNLEIGRDCLIPSANQQLE